MPSRNLSRSEQRLRRSQRIEFSCLPALLACTRCQAKHLSCFCPLSGPCSECVRSGMEKRCDSKGMDRTDKALQEQRTALDKAIEEAAAASARVSRIQKVVRRLESKSKKELDEIMKELENNDSGEGSSGSPGAQPSNEESESQGAGGNQGDSSDPRDSELNGKNIRMVSVGVGTTPPSWESLFGADMVNLDPFAGVIEGAADLGSPFGTFV
jgi:hypothetical protein